MSARMMEEFKHIVTMEGAKLLPFLKSVLIYFLQFIFATRNPIWTTVLKCAPIICLMIFVQMHGVRLSKEHSYSLKILCGLIFSCFGDALLNLNLFPHGMAAFGVAQVFYITAFGFQNFRLWVGFALLVPAVYFLSIVLPNINNVILTFGLPVYSTLLLTMCWRALDRVGNTTCPEQMYITKLGCALGSILFVISDGCIAIDGFVTPIPHRTAWIMGTYYAAQLLITLSVVRINNKIDQKPKSN